MRLRVTALLLFLVPMLAVIVVIHPPAALAQQTIQLPAEAPEPDQYLYAHADAAFIAQNVYLFAASEGPGTVVLGNVEKAELARTMKLRSNQILTFTQPIGYPSKAPAAFRCAGVSEETWTHGYRGAVAPVIRAWM